MLAGSALVWFLSSGVASAASYLLTVQPIQVCLEDNPLTSPDDESLTCANAARQLFEPETDKIWAQAGVDVEYLPWVTHYDTSLFDVDSAEVDMLFGTGGLAHGASSTPGVISMWFVGTLPSASDFGRASVLGPRTVIGDGTFSAGRRDTIAHELGHNLGLDHEAGEPINNLMTTGSVRGIPGGLADIFPDGAGRDQLTTAQITQVLNLGLNNSMLSEVLSEDSLASPEPSTLLLLTSGLAYAIRVVRRRRRLPPAIAVSTAA